jgi:hypothetical protein
MNKASLVVTRTGLFISVLKNKIQVIEFAMDYIPAYGLQHFRLQAQT